MPGAKLAFSETTGSVLITPRQLGPTSRMPAARHTATSSRWRCSPASPDLGEAGREDHESAHARRGGIAGDVDDLAGGHGDHGELCRLGHSRSEA